MPWMQLQKSRRAFRRQRETVTYDVIQFKLRTANSWRTLATWLVVRAQRRFVFLQNSIVRALFRQGLKRIETIVGKEYRLTPSLRRYRRLRRHQGRNAPSWAPARAMDKTGKN